MKFPYTPIDTKDPRHHIDSALAALELGGYLQEPESADYCGAAISLMTDLLHMVSSKYSREAAQLVSRAAIGQFRAGVHFHTPPTVQALSRIERNLTKNAWPGEETAR